MNKKILAGLDFSKIISESAASTQTGAELLNKYKSHMMANESTCSLVNNFIREASQHTYDNGVHEALRQVVDYIAENKTVWALTTTCESINAQAGDHNYLNRHAAKQVESLLEMEEADVVKYIKAGALKNVMYNESFRNIAKQVYHETPMVEAAADYTVTHPISMVESVGDGLCFEVNGTLYELADDKTIQESDWSNVSNTFRTVSSLLESNICKVDEFCINVTCGNATYEISEANKVVKNGKEGKSEMTVEQLRDNNRLMLMTANPRNRNQMAGILEAIALTCENYDHIVSMDNVGIYNTNRDRFIVIESASNMYATLLQSNHSQKWTINENAIDTLSFIKSKTNVSLSEVYNNAVQESMANISDEEKQVLESELKDQEVQNVRDRIAEMTERFKNDPVKLAVLSQLASKLN